MPSASCAAKSSGRSSSVGKEGLVGAGAEDVVVVAVTAVGGGAGGCWGLEGEESNCSTMSVRRWSVTVAEHLDERLTVEVVEIVVLVVYAWVGGGRHDLQMAGASASSFPQLQRDSAKHCLRATRV